MHTKQELLTNDELMRAVQNEISDVESVIASHVAANENPPAEVWQRYDDAVAAKVRLIQRYRRIVADVFPGIG